MPPLPCKCCGSPNHWDRECPDWNTYLERAKRSANSVEVWSEDESERAYASAYSVLLNERLSDQVVNQPKLLESITQQGFKQALSFPWDSVEKASKTSIAEAFNASRQTTIEEVEDEDVIAQQAKPKSPKHLLEKIEELGLSEDEDLERVEPNFRSPSPQSDEVESSSPQQEDTPNKEAFSSNTTMVPPTKDLKIKLKKR